MKQRMADFMHSDRINGDNRVKIYLAARYSRNSEMREYRDQLHSMGYKVTSQWIDQHGGQELESFTSSKLNSDPHYCAHFAQVDYSDLLISDMVIFFSSGNGSQGKGGRHVEFGMAVALNKLVIIIGQRENVFHCFSDIHQFDTWNHAKDCLSSIVDSSSTRRSLNL
jgi:hypothetical protein